MNWLVCIDKSWYELLVVDSVVDFLMVKLGRFVYLLYIISCARLNPCVQRFDSLLRVGILHYLVQLIFNTSLSSSVAGVCIPFHDSSSVGVVRHGFFPFP